MSRVLILHIGSDVEYLKAVNLYFFIAVILNNF